MSRIRAFLAIAGFCSCLTPVQSAVKYEFSATSSTNLIGEQITSAGFTLILPNFLTADTVIPASSLSNCFVSTTAQSTGGSCYTQFLFVNSSYNTILLGLNTDLNPFTYQSYYFDAGTFANVGVYDNLPSHPRGGHLVITTLPDRVTEIDAVPEPATWATMILGFGLIGGTMRSTRRRPKLNVSYA